MTICRFAIALSLTALPAFAGPVTPQGAARLTEVLQAHLGKTPGVVSVQPGNGVYEVRLDAMPMVAMLPPEAGKLAVDPWAFTLEDRGDGTWSYAQMQADWDLAYDLPNEAHMELRLGEQKGTGVFDERLMAFTSYTGTMRDMAMTQVITMPGQPEQRTTYTVGAGSWESTATPSATQGVDGRVTYALTDTVQTMRMPGMADPSQPFDVTVTIPRTISTGTSTGVDMPAIYGLLAWFVAHPSAEAITGDQADLKRLLTEGAPFFDRIDATSTLEGLVVATPVGEFGVDSASIEASMTGLVAGGAFREGITVKGLRLPEGLAPAWAADLIPADSTFAVGVSGFDLAAPAATLIPALDFTNPDLIDPAVAEGLVPQFMPTGAVTITLEPGGLTAPAYSLTYEGTMRAGPAAAPTGRATITLTGIDAIIAAINASPLKPEDGAAPAIAMARGMAKQGPDGALVWEIDATVPGTLKVNGIDLGPLLGGMQ